MQTTINNTQLPEKVDVPNYDRKQLSSRIVHLGFGAFHRAHQGMILNKLLHQDKQCHWGYCEVNLIGGEQLIEDLREQDNLYSVLEIGEDHHYIQVVGCVVKALHPQLDGIDAILEEIACPDTAIVSITVTEKGYCFDTVTQTLDEKNPLIIQDKANPTEPKSLLGTIVEGLARRKQRQLTGLTVMSCDNLPQNGVLTEKMVLAFAQLRDPELATWIKDNVTFPSTMVDRIVPAMTQESKKELTQVLGVDDPCGIVCEPFFQWVIEDNFISGRPQWENVGVQLVEDVLPFEHMKLRMLNGSHSFLAYLGYLAGYETIAETMTNTLLRQASYALMLKEQAVTLSLPENVDVTAYADSLIKRYSNSHLKHRTWQIASDGSQKLSQRVLDSVQFHIQYGNHYPLLALIIAGWMIYVSGSDLNGHEIDVQDPIASKLRQICDHHNRHNISVVRALISQSGVFPDALINNNHFIHVIENAYQHILTNGVESALANALSEYNA